MVRSTPPAEPSSLPPPPLNPPCPKALSQLLYPTHRQFRSQITTLLSTDPIFARRPHLSVAEHRRLTNARLHRLQQAGFLRNTISLASSEGSRRYNALIDTISLLDHSLEVKIGVTCGLFSASVLHLGTDEQKSYWLPRLESLQNVACFALTELGHGSNVRAIQTTATYSPDTSRFTIHTPCEAAQKYWIGAAGESASHAVVFAQLYIANVCYGIHAFIVRLRFENGRVVPGVRIADCGAKAGLNGVDNGRIWFSNLQIPREDLLSAKGQVLQDGTYRTSLSSSDAAFATLLAALTGGRVGIAHTSTMSVLLALTIAIRYSFSRRAFAPRPDMPEVPIIYYTTQQRLLMIPLATSFVYIFCARDLREEWYASIDSQSVSKRMHTLSAGYKALFTNFMMRALQAAREACGGQGYKSENVIAPLKADRDVMLTFEGVNGVLMQQVSKAIIAEYMAAKEEGRRFSPGSMLEALNVEPAGGRADSLDNAFFQRAFWKREKALVENLARVYAAAMRKCGSKFEAWNLILGDAEETARAHLERGIWEAHRGHVKKAYAKEKGCGEAMELCGKLWAINVVKDDWNFLRLGCVTTEEAGIVWGQVDDLCGKMTGIAESLLQGVGIADSLLAPIAKDYISHNSRAKL